MSRPEAWRKIADLSVPSGRLGIASALGPLDPDPYPCAPGTYGVYLRTAVVDGYEYVVGVRVARRFPCRRGKASRPVAIDHGHVGVFEHAGARAVIEAVEGERADQIADEVFAVAVARIVEWGQAAGQLPMVVASTGFGDGIYPVFELVCDGEACGFELVFVAEDELRGRPAAEREGASTGDGLGASARGAPAGAGGPVGPKPEAPVTAACLGCHDRFADRLKWQTHRHQPVEEGRCVACHAPQGSGAPRLLVDRFPEKAVFPFRLEEYALCWRCHDADAVLGEVAPVRTAFRNGGRNLHAEHVKQAVKGRSCASCHDAHAATQDKLVRAPSPAKGLFETVFRPSETGGHCVSRCHKPLAYDRVAPVAY